MGSSIMKSIFNYCRVRTIWIITRNKNLKFQVKINIEISNRSILILKFENYINIKIQ